VKFLYEDLPTINIAHSYEIFIWGSLSYQYCSLIWDFYMGISQLSKSWMSIKSMNIQSSVSIKSMSIQLCI
jgi:hypothetical protein